jgi:2-oxoglutarate ferredoxin oxidoreductase subunit alpha
MMEHIGLATMLETPCVFVNVQRGGPSTGLPTLPAQADIMQARWGSHGDYEVIALCPNSPQECFDLMVQAFNMAETYRVPVMMMLDECVGHMTEKVVIPSPDEIDIVERNYTEESPGEYLPYETRGDWVPPMVKAGDGYYFHVTGLTHDKRGYPAMNAEAQEECVHRIVDKIRKNADSITIVEEVDTEDADVIVMSYGITSRVSLKAISMAKAEGVKVGHLRLITVWPFPETRIRQLAEQGKIFVLPELNYGQMYLELQRVVEGTAPTHLVPHGGGTVHDPAVIFGKIMDAVHAKGQNREAATCNQ